MYHGCLQLTDDTSWATTLINNIQEQCVTHVSSQITLWFSINGTYKQPEVINNACPGDCNDRGTCIGGKYFSSL